MLSGSLLPASLHIEPPEGHRPLPPGTGNLKLALVFGTGIALLGCTTVHPEPSPERSSPFSRDGTRGCGPGSMGRPALSTQDNLDWELTKAVAPKLSLVKLACPEWNANRLGRPTFEVLFRGGKVSNVSATDARDAGSLLGCLRGQLLEWQPLGGGVSDDVSLAF
jgi:hypothetical protein